MGLFNPHASNRSLFGVAVPDFGLTEWIGGNKTAQGGSNLFGSSNAQTPVSNSNQGAGMLQQKLVTQLSGSPKAPAPTGGSRTPTSGGSATLNPTPQQPTGPNEAQLREQQVRGEIEGGYNNYFSQLDSILNEGLPGQKAAQEGIVQSQYNQGVNQLNTQKTLGQQDLNAQRTKATAQQSKTLTDLSDNIRNLFQSGNVYLGARGASDSSAANQYSYALTKMGSEQRGDVTAQYADINNDINGRETRLNELYNSEVNNLTSERDQKINSIAQWFGEQQNALKQAKAQGQLQKGQDLAALSQNLLNTALQQLQNVQAETSNRRSMLEQWAINKSNDIGSLKSNLAAVSTTNYAMPEAAPVSGQPAVAGGAGNPSLFGYGVEQDKNKTNLFGQPLR